jgi:Hint domain
MKSPHILLVSLALSLAACSPALVSPQATAEQVTPALPTPIVGTAVSDGSTILPGDTTPGPIPTFEPPTPIPTLESGDSPTDLKYAVLEQYPEIFYCDPDFYPVARLDELELALDRFPDLEANQEEFQSILSHNGLAGLTEFTDEQKLLIYQEHKKLAAIRFEMAEESYQFQIQVTEEVGGVMVVNGLIDGNGAITLLSSQPGIASCPICLAAGTRIDTPGGPVAVQDLRVGDWVWTSNERGERQEAVVLKATRALAPESHETVRVTLDDGRQLEASPSHPTAEGVALGALRVGDSLDGGRVIRIERTPYGQPATYDILPSGGTGWYWANGVLLASSLGKDW